MFKVFQRIFSITNRKSDPKKKLTWPISGLKRHFKSPVSAQKRHKVLTVLERMGDIKVTKSKMLICEDETNKSKKSLVQSMVINQH